MVTHNGSDKGERSRVREGVAELRFRWGPQIQASEPRHAFFRNPDTLVTLTAKI
jgi:hypothetical protein